MSNCVENAIFVALEAAACDEGFKLPTPKAVTALQLTEKIIKQSKTAEKREELACWSKTIVAKLHNCIPPPELNETAVPTLTKTKRERMWSSFHEWISSSSFRDMWVAVLGQSCSTLSQYLTRKIFDDLIKFIYPLPDENASGAVILQPELTSDEENALRYAAGYVINSLEVKFKKHHHSEMQYGLTDMTKSDGIIDSSENWLDSVDRGGLTHVNHTAFRMFHAMEMELRQHFTVSKIHDMDDHFKTKVTTSILADVDVNYYMACATEDLDEPARNELLSEIVNLYVTVRGFSFAKSWLEMFKQEHKRKLQKSKSLRSKLNCQNNKVLE